MTKADEGKIEQQKGTSMKSSIANPSENIYEIYYRLKEKLKRKLTIVQDDW